MTGRFTAAIIPTYNRPEVARECIDTLVGQVHDILVVDNGDTVPMVHDVEQAWTRWQVLAYPEHPGNLSRAWNQGIAKWSDWAAGDQFDLIIVNDDTLIPEGWVKTVGDRMREVGAAAACSGPADHVLTEPGIVPYHLRMQGWAFMLAGEKGLRVDEQFEWWCGDTDLDWRARQAGGMAMVSGFNVPNRFADQSTHGIRAEQANADVARFVAKWGMRPF